MCYVSMARRLFGAEVKSQGLSVYCNEMCTVYTTEEDCTIPDLLSCVLFLLQTIGTLEEVTVPQNGINHEGITALAHAFEHSPNLRVRKD